MKLLKILSYIYPITEKRIKSPVNGELSVCWEYGKRVVNTENANYSYGSLHTVFQVALKKVDLAKMNSILILGMGAGSIYKILREERKITAPITAIEKDALFKEILEEFYPEGLVNCKMHYEDVLDFLRKNKNQYDLILCDLFVDVNPLEACFEETFLLNIEKALTANGTYIHNTMLSDKSQEQDYFMQLESIFNEVELMEINGVNSVFIASYKEA